MAKAFYPNAQTVIDAALRVLAVSDPEGGLSPTTTERTNALEALNFLVTSWQADGLQVWCQKTQTITLVAGQASYTVGPGGDINIARPTQISQAWLRATTGTQPVDIPLNLIDRATYNALSVKTTQGSSNQLFYEPAYDLPAGNSGAAAKGRFYLWPVPDSSVVANYNLMFVYTRPIQDFNSTTDYLDFPQEWFNAIKWGLAAQIGFEYGVPVEIMDRIRKTAEDEKQRVLGWDTEKDSVFFQIDHRYETRF